MRTFNYALLWDAVSLLESGSPEALASGVAILNQLYSGKGTDSTAIKTLDHVIAMLIDGLFISGDANTVLRLKRTLDIFDDLSFFAKGARAMFKFGVAEKILPVISLGQDHGVLTSALGVIGNLAARGVPIVSHFHASGVLARMIDFVVAIYREDVDLPEDLYDAAARMVKNVVEFAGEIPYSVFAPLVRCFCFGIAKFESFSDCYDSFMDNYLGIRFLFRAETVGVCFDDLVSSGLFSALLSQLHSGLRGSDTPLFVLMELAQLESQLPTLAFTEPALLQLAKFGTKADMHASYEVRRCFTLLSGLANNSSSLAHKLLKLAVAEPLLRRMPLPSSSPNSWWRASDVAGLLTALVRSLTTASAVSNAVGVEGSEEAESESASAAEMAKLILDSSFIETSTRLLGAWGPGKKGADEACGHLIDALLELCATAEPAERAECVNAMTDGTGAALSNPVVPALIAAGAVRVLRVMLGSATGTVGEKARELHCRLWIAVEAGEKEPEEIQMEDAEGVKDDY